jgi:hypothetical protein
MHGGARGSGAPCGNKNALKLGLYTREAIAGRKALRNLLGESRKLMIRLATSREGSQDPEPDGWHGATFASASSVVTAWAHSIPTAMA